MPKCNFSKVALLCNFFETTLRHGCVLVNLVRSFRTPFPENTSGGLLLTNLKNTFERLLVTANFHFILLNLFYLYNLFFHF